MFDTPAQRELVREIARKSIVLLKNEGDLLPLPKTLGALAVIGPNANSKRNLLGDYSYPAHIETLITLNQLGFSEHPLPDSIHLVETGAAMISIVEAIWRAVSPATQVLYARGCEVNSSSTEGFAEPTSPDQSKNCAASNGCISIRVSRSAWSLRCPLNCSPTTMQ